MRILHTSDWHLGKSIENTPRIEEQTAFSKELTEIAVNEKVQLVVVAGDIFDTFVPPIWAEKLYYETLKSLTDKGIGVIVISGNHDSPQKLCSAESIARKSGIVMCEYPYTIVPKGEYGLFTVTDSGEGWFSLALSNGEKAVFASLSYPSESRIGKVIEYSEGEENIKADYNLRLKKLMEDLASHFKSDSANIMVSHLYINGGATSDSERNFQLGGAYAVNSDTIPASCDYVALGHLHRPQHIKECLAPTFYSGSPIGYSFSEAGYEKTVNIVDINDHKAVVKPVGIKSGKSLVSIRVNGAEEAVKWCQEHSQDENIWVEMKIVSSTAITSEQIKIMHSACPGIVSILPQVTVEGEFYNNTQERLHIPLEESFALFYKKKMGQDMPENIKKAFAGLRGEN
ncbi:MAG: exonuclease subunit SbcD [Clostridia bacterium]|nr:exonuclease subunit SbcD [Clostridia bacterium]